MTPTRHTRTVSRAARLGAALAAASLALVACGGDKSVLDQDRPSTTAAPSTAPTIGDTSNTEATTPSTGDTGETSTTVAGNALDGLPECRVDALDTAPAPVEITVWHSLSADVLSSTLAELTDRYNASQDRVRVKYINQGSYEDSIKKYLETSPKSRPDVVQLPEYMVQNTVDNHTAVPVGACIVASQFDTSAFLTTAMEAYSTGGVQWAMPFNVSTPELYYNRSLFEAAGLDPDQPPATLDELRTVSQQLVDSGAATYGIALESGFDSGGGWFLEQWFAQMGLTFVNNDNGRSGRATAANIDVPQAAEALGKLQSLLDDKLAVYVGDNSGTGYDNLLAMTDKQPAAMAIATSASLGSVLQILAGGQFPHLQPNDVGVAPMPTAGVPGNIIGGASLWITDSGDDARIAAAWDYISFMVAAQQQADWGSATGYVPVRTDANELEPMKSTLDDPRFGVAQKALSELPAGPASAGPVVGPLREIRLVMAEGIAKILTGADVATQLAQMQTQADNLIADYNARTPG